MASNDAHDRGQAEAAAGELGGEERIEDFCPRLGIHTAPGVLHLEEYVFALRRVITQIGGCEVLATRPFRPGTNRDNSLILANRFRCVGYQVSENLL